jgi:hypothetical protein
MVWFRVYINLNIALYCSDDTRDKVRLSGSVLPTSEDHLYDTDCSNMHFQHHLDTLVLRVRGMLRESLFTPLPPLD